MASSSGSRADLFGLDTPILRLTYERDRDSCWMLWPLLAWRVVAPVPRDRELNLFQRAVLGLIRANIYQIQEVAERLLIADSLAALVMMELQGMGLVNRSGAITPSGLRMLEEDELEATEDAKVGTVFTDPFSGKVWPRFLTGDLPLTDWETDDRGRVVLLSGSRGDRWQERAFSITLLDHETLVIAQPTTEEVLRAVRRHRQQRAPQDLADVREVPSLNRVSFIDSDPTPYYLATRACSHPSGDWMVMDPFGHGESAELRNQLEARFDVQGGLRQWLGRLMGADPDAPTLGQLQQDAGWKVEERLTLAIRGHEGLHDRLVAMQRAWLEASMLDSPKDKLDDVLVKAQRAAERLLHVLHAPYKDERPPFYNCLALNDREFNRQFLEAIASDMGFQGPLPATLTSVRRGKVQNAERHGGGSLRPLLLLVLLCADRYPAHPLRRAAKTHPDLLHRLDLLATARDNVAHDGDDAWTRQVPIHLETVFTAVETLLLQPSTNEVRTYE